VIPFISVKLMTDTQCHDQIDHRIVSINLCNSRIEQISCAVACSFHLLWIQLNLREERGVNSLRTEGFSSDGFFSQMLMSGGTKVLLYVYSLDP
jgi:hypothetical protein